VHIKYGKLVKLKGFAKLTSVDYALVKFMEAVAPRVLETETVPVLEALHRVLAANVVSSVDLPPFDRSTVDGYAVRARDTFGASVDRPKRLHLVEGGKIGEGEAHQVWTGHPMPKGSDSVVMLEYIRRLNHDIEVLMSVAPGLNVSRKGEDVRKGDLVFRKGRKLGPEDLGLLAALGLKEVSVVRRPKVAILSTGDELIDVGEKCKLGSVVDVNRVVLSNMVREVGGDSMDLGIARDKREEIKGKIEQGLAMADVVIITGGASVGKFDLSHDVLKELKGASILVHGISMRPGKPTALTVVKGKPVVLLSGNPVAAFFGFEVFVRPLLTRLLGVVLKRITIKAKLKKKVHSKLGHRVFLRVKLRRVNGEYEAHPISTHGSGVMTTLTHSDGYVIIPEDREGLEAGERVTVHLLRE
jgi:molybdenum cofactor synthesis domain-containing protein